MREFLDTTLLYADSIAIAVGSPPPQPSPPPLDDAATAAPGCSGQQQQADGTDHGNSPVPQPQARELSLLQLISGEARKAEREAPPRSRGGDAVDGQEEGGGEGGEGGGVAGGVSVVSVFEVSPWGKFTPALNALLGFAARDGAELVMFQARERESTCLHTLWWDARRVRIVYACASTRHLGVLLAHPTTQKPIFSQVWT